MRTARSRISGEKRFDFLFMAPSSQSLEPPQNPGRFSKDKTVVYWQIGTDELELGLYLLTDKQLWDFMNLSLS
jgi:hypothetical protein